MKLTIGDVRDILEKHEIYSDPGYCENDNGKGWEEFSYCSPLNEDFIMTLWHEDNAESLSEALTKYAEDFDPEEHAAMWYNNGHPAPGTPSSLMDLLEDAKHIKAHLTEAAYHVEVCVENGEILPVRSTREEQDALLDNLITYCVDACSIEVVRNAYEEVQVDSDCLSDSFKVRFHNRIFRISIEAE